VLTAPLVGAVIVASVMAGITTLFGP